MAQKHRQPPGLVLPLFSQNRSRIGEIRWLHRTMQLTGRRTSSQQQQFQAREGCLSTCSLGGLGGLGITSPAEHVAKALSCKQASPKLKVCRHESRVGSRVDIKLAAVRFQTDFGVTKSPNGLRQKLTVKEVGLLMLLQNFCSSSPWYPLVILAPLCLTQEKLGVWQPSWQLGSWSSKMLCHCSELALEATILDMIGSD